MNRLTVLALPFAFLACGGDGDNDGPNTAVADYTEAFANGDADRAWSLVSERCHDEIDEDDYKATVRNAGEFYPDMTANDISADVDGDNAAVSYRVTELDVEYSDQPWVFESEGWHYDDC